MCVLTVLENVICEKEQLVILETFPLDMEYRITTLRLGKRIGAVEAGAR